jgi:DNA-binding LytR/AlgR family response regulator
MTKTEMIDVLKNDRNYLHNTILFEGIGNYVRVVRFRKKSELIVCQLGEIEKIIKDKNYFRINRKYLINTKRIKLLYVNDYIHDRCWVILPKIKKLYISVRNTKKWLSYYNTKLHSRFR